MSCNGIDDDYTSGGLPPLPPINKMATWNGREVRVLDPSKSLIGKGIEIPLFPQHLTDSSFYQRHFKDLTHAEFTEDQDPCEES